MRPYLYFLAFVLTLALMEFVLGSPEQCISLGGC